MIKWTPKPELMLYLHVLWKLYKETKQHHDWFINNCDNESIFLVVYIFLVNALLAKEINVQPMQLRLVQSI